MRGKNIHATVEDAAAQLRHDPHARRARGPLPRALGSTGNPVFCGFWTYLGVPAVTLPLLEVDGLPMGVQLIGARRDDGRLLRYGARGSWRRKKAD